MKESVLSSPAFSPSLLLESLCGKWSLTRVYDPMQSHFDGMATFSRLDATSLSYAETGVLRMPSGYVGAAHQDYVYAATLDGLDVFHMTGWQRSGRFLHLDLTAVADCPLTQVVEFDATHECPPDSYWVRYIFALPLSFRTEIEVEGPRKRYRIFSDYRRQSPRQLIGPDYGKPAPADETHCQGGDW